MTHDLIIQPDVAALARWGADMFSGIVAESTAAGGEFYVALSGGSTPRALYTLLGQEPYAALLPWKQMHWFFGDERYVPPDHAESNARMVRDTLFRQIPASAAHLYVMPTDHADPADAAAAYEATMREVLHAGEADIPVFDCLFLGMGADGHTASLFPGTQFVTEAQRLVVATESPDRDISRLTCTFPLINAARRIIIFVSGENKAEMLRRVLEGKPKRYPIQHVAPTNGTLTWAVDAAAAHTLENTSA